MAAGDTRATLRVLLAEALLKSAAGAKRGYRRESRVRIRLRVIVRQQNSQTLYQRRDDDKYFEHQRLFRENEVIGNIERIAWVDGREKRRKWRVEQCRPQLQCNDDRRYDRGYRSCGHDRVDEPIRAKALGRLGRSKARNCASKSIRNGRQESETTGKGYTAREGGACKRYIESGNGRGPSTKSIHR